MMRAKLLVTSVVVTQNEAKETVSEELKMIPVGPKGPYPPDGSDENNTYAKFSPSGDLRLVVMNPALFGRVKEGQEYYLDFTAIKKLEEWQERVIEEQLALDERRLALDKYMDSPAFEKLGEEEKSLLFKQKKTMVAYSKALGERIAKF
ncbi:MAG TPA: hypothetical protein VGH19_06485 [Verrucomicrobiae bacterium]